MCVHVSMAVKEWERMNEMKGMSGDFQKKKRRSVLKVILVMSGLV